MACLMLASKFYDRRTPSIEDLCTVAQHQYAELDFRTQELEILSSLHWLLHGPLPQTCFSLLLRLTEISEDAIDGNAQSQQPSAKLAKIQEGSIDAFARSQRRKVAKIKEWGAIFIELTSFEYTCLKFSPLVTAMACLLCAVRFEPYGSKVEINHKLHALRHTCAIDSREVDECIESVLACYGQCLPESGTTLPPASEPPVSAPADCTPSASAPAGFEPISPDNDATSSIGASRCGTASPDSVIPEVADGAIPYVTEK